MHPSFALWMWSMTMMRIMQNPFGKITADAKSGFTPGAFQFAPAGPQGFGENRTDAIHIRADQYLRSDVVESPLPSTILDKLADLHWMERDPDLAI